MLQPRLLYLFGEPGCGKTTLLKACLAGLEWEQHEKPFAFRVFSFHGQPTGMELGAPDAAGFGGTDRLSFSVFPKVAAWLQQFQPHTVIAEGDRLASLSFWESARQTGYLVRPVLLWTPQAAARRAARAAALGKGEQNESWVAGRVTKVQRLEKSVANWQDFLKVETSEETLVTARTLLDLPEFRRLRGDFSC